MKFSIGISLIFLLLVQYSCKKKERAGYGGNASLKLSAMHHGEILDSVTFYVKFNSSDAPSDNSYDFTQSVKSGDSTVSISGLKKGDYYIYALGYDADIFESVKGGVPYTIEEEKQIEVTVAVSEVH